MEELDELKTKLATAESFSEVMDFFFDHFGESREFMALGKRVKSPFMNDILKVVGQELMGPGVQITGRHFVLLKKHGFLHGTAHLNGAMTVLFFFKDIDMGMLVCQVGDESKFARFTSYTVKGEEPPVFPTPTSKLTH